MAALTSTNLKALVDATTQWHRIFASDRVRLHMNPQYVSQLEVFVGEARMIRWGLVATEEKVAEIWQLIMPGGAGDSEGSVQPDAEPVNENIIDYVLNGAAYVQLMADIASGHYENFLEDLSLNICWPYKAKYIDNEMKERSAEPSFIKALFTNTGWALFVYLLSISPLEFDEAPLVFGPTSSTGDKD